MGILINYRLPYPWFTNTFYENLIQFENLVYLDISFEFTLFDFKCPLHDGCVFIKWLLPEFLQTAVNSFANIQNDDK